MTTLDGTSAIEHIPPRILIIDHHDSYTHNLLICLLDALTKQYCGTNTAKDEEIQLRKKASEILLSRCLILPFTHPIWQNGKESQMRLLKNFDALILGPGPGRPDVKEDFGASMNVLQSFILENQITIPTLGICLGHQGIAMVCGAKLKRADNIRHGMISELFIEENHNRLRWPSILQDVDSKAKMITYNSLIVDHSTLPKDQIRLIAWANDEPVEKSHAHMDESEKVVMAIQHVEKPIWGVQFHPESIASEGGGRILDNFLQHTYRYWQEQEATSANAIDAKVRLQSWSKADPLPSWIHDLSAMPSLGPGRSSSLLPNISEHGPKLFKVITHSLGTFDPKLAPVAFKILFGDEMNKESTESAVWLDSARQGGRHSRYSFMSQPSWSVRYNVDEKEMSIRANGKEEKQSLMRTRQDSRSSIIQPYGLPTPQLSRTNSPEMLQERQEHQQGQQTFWNWLDNVQQTLQNNSDHSAVDSIPFRTGFIGYFGYEMKYEALPSTNIGVGPVKQIHTSRQTKSQSRFPSSWFGFCDKILVIDHFTGEWSVMGLIDVNEATNVDFPISNILQQVGAKVGSLHSQWYEWVGCVKKSLGEISKDHVASLVVDRSLHSLRPIDTREEYMRKVEDARQLISEGQSYELCLSTEFRGEMTTDKESDAKSHFDIYTSSRARNPAPFSAFLRLERREGEKQKSILATSPEKFFGMDAQGCVEMKPIKGTMARAGYGKGDAAYLQGLREGDPKCTQWCQEEDVKRVAMLQADAKERAENLMIVDLIRRDLLQFCPPESVNVSKLMGIESYETVHQLVTTVEGKKPVRPSNEENYENGFVGTVEAIQQCFPPGSMTGAPKVRSVQLLESLEHSQSSRQERGVYSGIIGWISIDGAASFSVVIRTICLNGKNVSIGAGGAITFHSKAEKEWQEVLDKVGAIASLNIE